MSQATTSARPARAPGRPSRPAPLRAVPKAIPRAIERSGSGTFAAICMGLLAVGLLALLLLNTALAQGAFTVQNLALRSGTLTDEEHELRQAIQAQSNSAALAGRATELGMVPAKSMAFLRLSDGAIIGVAEPAAPEPFVVVTAPRPAPSPEPTAPAATTAPADPTAPTAPADPTAPTAPAPAEPAPPAPPAAAPTATPAPPRATATRPAAATSTPAPRAGGNP